MYAIYDFRGDVVYNDDGTGYQQVYQYHTNDKAPGELKIIKLDTKKQIISGTFWFNCEEANSAEVAEIREGRFDINYTSIY